MYLGGLLALFLFLNKVANLELTCYWRIEDMCFISFDGWNFDYCMIMCFCVVVCLVSLCLCVLFVIFILV